MNIKLEEFVKEYICMEQDIHIEDMQQSVMEYGRMRRKIEDTCQEIQSLKEICNQHSQVNAVKHQTEAYGYYAAKLIDDAGLRGFSVGGAQVSEKHCGFVINRDNATAADIHMLIMEVQRRVKQSSQVTIEPEVILLGFGEKG